MNRSSLIFFLIFTVNLIANDTTRADYLELIRNNPEIVMPLGNASKGEIEIILDPLKMAEIEKKSQRDVGILKSDSYWIWINDACKFPDGSFGVIGRILAKNLQRSPGAAVLPLLPNGKVVLNVEFRHSTRQWELELPRGGVKQGETLEAAARREVLEETGMVVDQLIRLGEMTGDSGVTGMIIPIFMGKITSSQKPDRESSEAIHQTLQLTLSEIEKAYVRGYIDCDIHGETIKVFVRDPFLAYALTILHSQTVKCATIP